MPELLSWVLGFGFISLSSAHARSVWPRLLLGWTLWGLIVVLGLKARAVAGPWGARVVNLHLVGVPVWICHGIVGIVGSMWGRRGVMGVGGRW